MKLPRWFWWMGAFWCLGLSLRTAPFTIVLELQGRSSAQSVTNGVSSLDRRQPSVRPVLQAGIDEPLTVRFRVMRPGGPEVEDALFHMYVAPEEKLNQSGPPDLKPAQVVLESAFSADFQADGSAEGTISFRVSRPGLYLVRVEGLDMGTAGTDGPFAALDLQVKEKASK
jgi:hypothetical protein